MAIRHHLIWLKHSLKKLNTELNQNDTYLKEASASSTKTANSIDNMGRQVSNKTKRSLGIG